VACELSRRFIESKIAACTCAYISPLASKSRLGEIIAISIPGYKVSSASSSAMVFTVAFLSAKSWRALTRVFLERRGLIAIDELVIFFDPPFPTSALSYGKEEAAATTGGSSLHRLRRKSLFSLLTIPPRVASDIARRLFRARRRPRDPMPRGHVGAHPASSSPSSSLSSSHLSRMRSLPSPLFAFVPSFLVLLKERPVSSWKTRTPRNLVSRDLDGC